MRLDPSLNITLEGSLNDLSAAVGNTEETREREQKHPKVQYKLRLADNPAAQNMPHEEDYSDNNF